MGEATAEAIGTAAGLKEDPAQLGLELSCPTTSQTFSVSVSELTVILEVTVALVENSEGAEHS